ncbi:site-specific integrase [Desulfomicrobium orale]|uniref:site-specific integrase n=1 Tax=Desulfomicrobium orale TaxID=132132 RepID=UPI00124555B0|nr:site-specific integrase [Desulfomicrobium orale]
MAIPKIRLRSYDNRRVRFLSKSEARKLLEELRQNLLWHDITAIALYTGLRAGEIFSLRKSSLDIQNRYIHIFDTKSTLNRSIYLNAQALEVVQRHACLNRPYLFFNDQTCSPIRFVSRIFTSAVERAGLNPPDVDRRNKVVFHTLRHTFASWLVQDGTPLAVVAQLLGHTNIRMTMRYAHLAPSQGIKHLINLGI